MGFCFTRVAEAVMSSLSRQGQPYRFSQCALLRALEAGTTIKDCMRYASGLFVTNKQAVKGPDCIVPAEALWVPPLKHGSAVHHGLPLLYLGGSVLDT